MSEPWDKEHIDRMCNADPYGKKEEPTQMTLQEKLEEIKGLAEKPWEIGKKDTLSTIISSKIILPKLVEALEVVVENLEKAKAAGFATPLTKINQILGVE